MKRNSIDQAVELASRHLRRVGGDPRRLSEPARTLVLVYGAQGVIDNGGFRYFFENDWPGRLRTRGSRGHIGALVLGVWRHCSMKQWARFPLGGLTWPDGSEMPSWISCPKTVAYSLSAIEFAVMQASGGGSRRSWPRIDATLRPPNDELQRTSDGNAAGFPLNSVLGGHEPRG
jgi:hypothetical protein